MCDLNQFRFNEAACNLRANSVLALFHPAPDHFLTNLLLMRGQYAGPQVRRVQPYVRSLLGTIPLRKVLAQILAKAQAVCFCVTGILGKLL